MGVKGRQQRSYELTESGKELFKVRVLQMFRSKRHVKKAIFSGWTDVCEGKAL
jgi:hypothetical protein